MRFVETSGKTVDEAITAALLELGLPSEDVEIEVLQESSKGVLGIFGAKEARIRATAKVKSVEEELFENTYEQGKKKAEEPVKKPEAVKETVKPSVKEPVKEQAKKAEKAAEPAKSEKPYVMDTLVEERLAAAKARKEARAAEEAKPKEPIAFTEETTAAKEAAVAFLLPVLEKMGVENASIQGVMEEEDVLCLNIEGKELGVIIGKRGNTLDSLQYITALVANKNIEGHVKIKLDAENYRAKRRESLEKLAVNLARKVKKTGHKVSLEPMNPYERRIIHATLQDFNGVETHSEGEEPFRKVIISPVARSGRRNSR